MLIKGVPAVLVAPVVTVTVYWVLADRLLAGVKVATVLLAFKPTCPVTFWPLTLVLSVKVVGGVTKLAGFMASLKVALMGVAVTVLLAPTMESGTLTAP